MTEGVASLVKRMMGHLGRKASSILMLLYNNKVTYLKSNCIVKVDKCLFLVLADVCVLILVDVENTFFFKSWHEIIASSKLKNAFF